MKYRIEIRKSKIIEADNLLNAYDEAYIWMIDEKGSGYGAEIAEKD